MASKTYKCTSCNKEFTVEIPINDELKECLECKSEVKRVYKTINYNRTCNGFVGKIMR